MSIFDNLADELILEIFTYVSWNIDRQSLRLVCQRFFWLLESVEAPPSIHGPFFQVLSYREWKDTFFEGRKRISWPCYPSCNTCISFVRGTDINEIYRCKGILRPLLACSKSVHFQALAEAPASFFSDLRHLRMMDSSFRRLPTTLRSLIMTNSVALLNTDISDLSSLNSLCIDGCNLNAESIARFPRTLTHLEIIHGVVDSGMIRALPSALKSLVFQTDISLRAGSLRYLSSALLHLDLTGASFDNEKSSIPSGLRSLALDFSRVSGGQDIDFPLPSTLQSLTVVRCSNNRLLRSLPPNLQFLKVSESWSANYFDNEAMKRLPKSLKILRLCLCRGINDRGFSFLPNLVALRVVVLSEISNEAFRHLPPTLLHLSISMCGRTLTYEIIYRLPKNLLSFRARPWILNTELCDALPESLRLLNVGSISSAAIERLRSERPFLKVIYDTLKDP